MNHKKNQTTGALQPAPLEARTPAYRAALAVAEMVDDHYEGGALNIVTDDATRHMETASRAAGDVTLCV